MFVKDILSETYGCILGFWAISDARVDGSGNVYVTLSGWVDQSSHDAGFPAIDRRIEIIKDSGQLNLCTQSVSALSAWTNANPPVPVEKALP